MRFTRALLSALFGLTVLGITPAAANIDGYTSTCDPATGYNVTCTSPNPGGATLTVPATPPSLGRPALCASPDLAGSDIINLNVPAGYSVYGNAAIFYLIPGAGGNTVEIPATGPLGTYVFSSTPNPLVGFANQNITIVYPPVSFWQTTFVQNGQNMAEIHVDLHFFVQNSSGVTVGELGAQQDWDVTCPQTTPPPPPPTTQLKGGMTATIGFWHNKNGQALILGENGGPTSTNLASYLVTQYPFLFGCYNLQTNQDVANLFLKYFNTTGQKLQAQILGVALATYVTNSSLGTGATQYGFTVSQFGTGQATYNVGSNGAAFGVPNNTTLTVTQILAAANTLTGAGASCNPYAGNTGLQNMANSVFDGINSTGDIK